jgi:hypothetical protein
MSSPAHIEMIAEEKNDEIVKEKEEKQAPKQTRKQIAQAQARARVKVGGGVSK